MMFLSEFSPPAGSSEVRTVPGFPDTFSVGNPSNRDVVPGFPGIRFNANSQEPRPVTL